jgi:NADPH-dependent 2,4-dienoyl-CoA reductase/sulfur reductase-like enzyme
MPKLDRRQFTTLLGLTGTSAWTFGAPALAQGVGKVVIVGGGPGGATVAHMLKRGAPQLDVTLVEVQQTYTTCFFSNLYLGGLRTLPSITHSYDHLRKLGIKVVHDVATDVDTTGKTVKLRGGQSLSYDKLVLSPGIDFKWDSVPGYSEAVAQIMPHAYKAGAQTALLKRQLDAMPDNGVVIMVTPPLPFRCPPGPYERMCMIGHLIKTRKRKAKLIVLDPKKDIISKGPAFREAWDTIYKDIIDIRLSNEIDDQSLAAIDPKAMTVTTKADGTPIKGDVINIIPAQKAGEIAFRAGVTEGDWCPINPADFTSTKIKDVHVIGDSSIASPMPKSASSANGQGKLVADAILAALARKDEPIHRLRNTCWSALAPDNSIVVGASYALKDGKLDASGVFVSKPGEDAAMRKKNFEDSTAWYDAVTAEIFANPAIAPPKSGRKG